MDHPRQHQALVRTTAGLQVRGVPTPLPEEGGLLVATSFVGVCGTDLQILNGSRPDCAEILGHEASGVIVETGPGAGLRQGQTVVFNPSAQLTRGRILGHNVAGLFQEYFLVDAQAIGDGLVQAAEQGFPAICGALVEPVGGIIYTHELISHVLPDPQAAVVFGAGPIGLIAVEYLRERGTRAFLVHSSQTRLDTIADLGLVDASCVAVAAGDLSERILSWNSGRRLDSAIICTSMAGASEALRQAVAVLRDGACVEMVTNFPAASPTPQGISAEALRSVRAANICGIPENGAYVHATVDGRRMAFTSHRGTSRKHMIRAMRVLSGANQRYTRLITHILSLCDAPGAIDTLARTRKASIAGRDCIKAVVDLTRKAGRDTANAIPRV